MAGRNERLTEDIVRNHFKKDVYSRRIGHENVSGYLDGGLETWRASGGPVEVGATISVSDLAKRLQMEPYLVVIDVRQASEYEASHVPGALHLHAGDLPNRLAELPRDRPMATWFGRRGVSVDADGLFVELLSELF